MDYAMGDTMDDTTLADLPVEIIVMILSFLPIYTILEVRATTRWLKAIVDGTLRGEFSANALLYKRYPALAYYYHGLPGSVVSCFHLIPDHYSNETVDDIAMCGIGNKSIHPLAILATIASGEFRSIFAEAGYIYYIKGLVNKMHDLTVNYLLRTAIKYNNDLAVQVIVNSRGDNHSLPGGQHLRANYDHNVFKYGCYGYSLEI
jgi:hypothetical protein